MPPKQMPKSGAFAQKFGAKLQNAHKQHATEKTEYGNMGDLPDGISGGVAKLVDIKLMPGKKNPNDWFFYAAGVVVSPAEFKGMRTIGMRTSILEPLGDTPTRSRKTFEDHMGWVYNELRKLGLDTSNIDPNNLEAELAFLKEAAPYFTFRTWKGPKQTTGQYAGREPRVNHDWKGIITDYVADEAVQAVVDSTPIVEVSPEAHEDDEQAEAAEAVEAVDVNGSNGNEVATEQIDLVALGKDADNPKSKTAEKSQEQLTALAYEHGMTDDDLSKTPDWKTVANMITEASSTGEGTEENPDGPQVGQLCMFKPKNPKNPKVRLSAVQCEIVAVNGDTVDLKNLTNQKLIYKGASIEELDFS